MFVTRPFLFADIKLTININDFYIYDYDDDTIRRQHLLNVCIQDIYAEEILCKCIDVM